MAMEFLHRYQIQAPLAKVVAFHRQPANLIRITPFPIRLQIHHAPTEIAEGANMDWTLWLGPLPIRWLALFEDHSSTSFTDRQVRGPFASWVHRHSFKPVRSGWVEVEDRVEAHLLSHPIWTLVGLAMWLSLPVLFAYRTRKTRLLLEGRTT